MDQKELDLIERITQEVVARIQAGRAASVSAPPPVEAPLASELSRYIDHTLLKPEATEEQVNKLCEEAAKHCFYSVCVNSSWAEHCARKLGGTGVKVCAVVGFPLGAMDSRAKAFEARTAIANGASEIDMVMNVGAMKAGILKLVREDMLAVRRACRQKHPHYKGQKIMMVRPVDPEGKSLLAVDGVQAGIGDLVLVVDEGGSARTVIGDESLVTVRTAIRGIVDRIDIEDGRRAL